MSDTVQVLADDNPLAVDASRYHLIDDKTRALTQPEDENEKILGVETDKDVVRRYFKCPKIVGDNIDLSQCQLYVGYIGAKDEKGQLFFDEEPGRYHCDDVAEDGDYLLFSWKLSGNVFLRDGYVAYNIYAVSNNGDETEMVWNTIPAIGKVLRTVPKGTDIVERFPDVINQLFERLLALEAKIGNGGGTGGSSVVNTDYKWIKSGQMRTPVRDFQGWAHCVQYDKELGKAVGIVISGTGSHSNTMPLYRVTIENNGYMSPYEEITFNYPESDNNPSSYIGSFLTLEDGTYWLCDYRQRIFTSSDKGYTWDFVTQLALNGRNTYNNDSLFGVTVLSNGRFVGGNIGNVASETYYSDNGIDWTTVVMDVSQLGQQTYPEGNYVPFEPFFIDCGNGKVVQYARASMNAFKTFADGNWTKQEGAVYSVSEDYGTTWTPWKWSESIVDMTANNGKVVVIGDVVHCVYGSRYIGYTDEYGNTPFFALRYTHTTLEKVLNDEWEESVVIDVGHWDEATSTLKADCGYPSIWRDENNNLFAVYYDSAENGLPYGANWRLLFGNPYVQKKAVEDSGSGSKNVAYSQAQVDLIVSGLMTKINELYMLVGQMPEDSGNLDGSQPVFNGLVEWFDVGDETQWTDKTVKSKIGSGKTGTGVKHGSNNFIWSTIAPISYENGLAEVGLLLGGLDGYGVSDTFSIEFVYNVLTNSDVFKLLTSPANTSGTANNAIISLLNKSGSEYMKKGHMILVYENGTITQYFNGSNKGVVKTLDDTSGVGTSQILVRGNEGKIGHVRLYNRALTAQEIKNNYEFVIKTTDLSVDSSS